MKQRFVLCTLGLLLVISSCKKDEVSEVQLETSSVSDIDGNVYETVKIGDQWWMTENLMVKHFNDGSEISYVAIFEADTVWAKDLGPNYTFLNDTIYGCLYDMATVMDARGLAPEGWHVATDEDWKNLEKTVGMSGEEVNKLAWRGTREAEEFLPENSDGWPSNTVPFGSGKYKMNVLPAGCKLFDGSNSVNSNMAFFWTSTMEGNQGYYRYFDYKKKTVYRQRTYAGYGMSVRCVKN